MAGNSGTTLLSIADRHQLGGRLRFQFSMGLEHAYSKERES